MTSGVQGAVLCASLHTSLGDLAMSLPLRRAGLVAFCGVAVFGLVVPSASAAPSPTVRGLAYTDVALTSPNGAARVAATIAWQSKTSYTIGGQLFDQSCNSHSVFVDIISNQGTGYQHRDKLLNNNGGCNTATPINSGFNSSPYSMLRVLVNVCDDGVTDSCSALTYNNPIK